MTKQLKRVALESDTDLIQILEEVQADKEPRLIERDGEPLVVVIDPASYDSDAGVPKSRQFGDQLMSLAGAWSDLDADAMIENIYRGRNEAPPSPPTWPID